MISITELSGNSNQLAESAARFFGPDGALSALEDFEFRPQQQEMGVAVARALEESQSLIVEAGTGVGKSLAYLAPAVELALDESRQAVVSTHTINLQEQLVGKDIPLLQKVLDRPFKPLLLKGRRNYLCPKRLEAALYGGRDMFSTSDIEELKAIQAWAGTTRDGTLSDLDFSPNPRVWAQVCSESHICTAKSCGFGSRCFYQEVRKRVAEADVIVVNHTLFFTLFAGREEFLEEEAEFSFLFPNDFLIFDEAHTLEQVAARQLGLNLSASGLRFDLHRLFNPKNKKGLFQVTGDSEGRQATMRLLDEIDGFFEQVDGACQWGEWGREFRVRDPEFVDDTLGSGLIEVSRRARKVGELAKETIKAEMLDLADRLGQARGDLATFLEQSDDGLVYWVEKGGDRNDAIRLVAAHVDVSEILRPVFFESGRPCIFTSATLGTGDRDLNYYRRRVGAEEARAVRIGSPFEYQRQMKIHLVRPMPAPGAEGYEEALERWIAHYVGISGGSAFVLFTSYRLLAQVADAMEDHFFDSGLQLLVQGRGKSRKQLIEAFKEDESSVLFGTDSFWTGVDVPGSALTNVIITRLPFAVPDHPLTQARLEAIDERGGNSFMEYSVPEAILKLRQGVGRLIRSEDDRGMVVILDNRVLSKRYGSAFLNALPDAPVEIEEGEDSPAR